ncbi:MAG: PD-(D/E)XK nuclease family protein [Planctomycetaceae bacterium]|nr:PD-(D/E)XK nuclease family protein [Planctomycetaceae bacterium]
MKPPKHVLRQNIFEHATSELSHSALWAWILSCAQSEEHDRRDVRRLAEAFLHHVGYSAPLPRVTSVEREVTPRDGEKMRFDIVASLESGDTLLIENKVKALPDEAQLRSYAEHHPQSTYVLLHAGFNSLRRSYEWKRLGEVALWKRIGIEGILEVIDSMEEPLSHSLLIDYDRWLRKLAARFEQLTVQALSNDVAEVNEALKSPQGQYAFVDNLCNDLDGVIQLGTSSGRPWTEFAFLWLENDEPGKDDYPDMLFYRLDATSRGIPYLAIRQYHRLATGDAVSLQKKRDRLTLIRTCWAKAVAQSDQPSLNWRPPGNRLGFEMEVCSLLLNSPENSPAKVRRALPGLHKGFLEELRKVGWPISERIREAFPGTSMCEHVSPSGPSCCPPSLLSNLH